MTNVYYEPEKFGLTVVGELEYSSGDYEFDTRVVWQHADGKFYTARDSGCSCPVPFEDYQTLNDIELLDVDALQQEFRSNINRFSMSSIADAHELMEKIRAARA